jgi:ubiquitin C-terminal hydrolase
MDIKALTSLPKYHYYKFNDAEMVPPNGFINTGAICWFNSMLQALLSLTSLTEIMLKCEDDFIMKPLGRSYIELIKAINNNEDVSQHNLRVLNAFRDELGNKKFKFLTSNGQECANEGFILFIDALKCKRVEHIFESIYRAEIKCPQCGSTKIERVKSIQVPFYTDRNISVDQFTGYLKCHRSDVLDYECPGHDVTVGIEDEPNTKSVVHERIPIVKVVETAVRHGEVIVVNFNRMFNRKRSYPTTLTFKGINNTTIKYELVATIEHSGHVTMNYSSGHYWSRAVRADENGDREWCKLNDSSANKCDDKINDSESMLFYHMV